MRFSLAAFLVFLVAILFPGCANIMRDSEGHSMIVDRDDVRLWDPCNSWQKTGSHPSTYVPIGMKKGDPVDEANGQWFVDPQDHSRFYVPNVGPNNLPHDFLVEQARIATSHMATVWFPLVLMGEAIGSLGR